MRKKNTQEKKTQHSCTFKRFKKTEKWNYTIIFQPSPWSECSPPLTRTDLPPEAPAVSDNVRMVFFSPADVAVRAGKNKCEKKGEVEDDIMLPRWAQKPSYKWGERTPITRGPYITPVTNLFFCHFIGAQKFTPIYSWIRSPPCSWIIPGLGWYVVSFTPPIYFGHEEKAMWKFGVPKPPDP